MAVFDAVSITVCAVVIADQAADIVAWCSNNWCGSGIGIDDVAVLIQSNQTTNICSGLIQQDTFLREY